MGFGANLGKSQNNSSGSSTGQDTTSGHTTFDTNTQATNPDWVVSGVQGAAGNASRLAGTDPANYVAGATPLLRTAANAAGDLSGTPWSYDSAQDITRGVAQADTPDIASSIRSFLNPYLKQVVGATSADLDHSDGIARANDDLALAGSGAFGGSGAALTKAATEDALSRARATSIGGLESQGFDTALQGATSQAQLTQAQQAQRLAAGAQTASIADAYGANQRANIAAQDAAGAPIQAIDQQKAQAPLDLQSWLAQNYASLPLGLFQGQTQAGTEDQAGTEQQVGTTKGKATTTSGSVGFGK